jgi:hypothetical protein
MALPPKRTAQPTRDEYNAEWLDALARLEAREADRHAAEDVLYREHCDNVQAQRALQLAF